MASSPHARGGTSRSWTLCGKRRGTDVLQAACFSMETEALLLRGLMRSSIWEEGDACE